MSESRVSVRIEVYQYVATQRRAERERIIRWIESLQHKNFETGDYTERDESDRVVQVKIIDRHALSFWHDGPVSEFKVIGIELADA